jgi:hypothetical protein
MSAAAAAFAESGHRGPLDAGVAGASDQSGRHAYGLLANVVVKAANLTKAEKEAIF